MIIGHCTNLSRNFTRETSELNNYVLSYQIFMIVLAHWMNTYLVYREFANDRKVRPNPLRVFLSIVDSSMSVIRLVNYCNIHKDSIRRNNFVQTLWFLYWTRKLFQKDARRKIITNNDLFASSWKALYILFADRGYIRTIYLRTSSTLISYLVHSTWFVRTPKSETAHATEQAFPRSKVGFQRNTENEISSGAKYLFENLSKRSIRSGYNDFDLWRSYYSFYYWIQ